MPKTPTVEYFVVDLGSRDTVSEAFTTAKAAKVAMEIMKADKTNEVSECDLAVVKFVDGRSWLDNKL